MFTPDSFWQWFYESLSFFASFVFHLFMLIIMAFLVISPQQVVSIEINMAVAEDEALSAVVQLDFVDEIEFADPEIEIPEDTPPTPFALEIPEVEFPLGEQAEAMDDGVEDSYAEFDSADLIQMPTVAFSVGNSGAAPARAPRDLAQRLRRERAGGGDVQITLTWNNVNDLDLHVICPSGEKIFYRRMLSRCGGNLDVDMNVSEKKPWSQRPIENVFWPSGGSPRGEYIVIVDHYENNGARDPTRYWVTVSISGQPDQTFMGNISGGQAQQVVCRFRL